MSWNNVISQFSEQAKRVPQQKIASLIAQAAVVIIAYQLAGLTWQMVPTKSSKGVIDFSVSDADITIAPKERIDISNLARLNLFGQEQKGGGPKPPEPIKKKDEEIIVTKLNAKLFGVMASNEKALASAIIEIDRKQDSYQIGSKLGNNNAIIDEIHPDHVIIRNNGKLEKLELIENAKGTIDTSNMPEFTAAVDEPDKREAEVIDKTDDAELSQTLADARNNLISDPSSFSKLLRLRPIKRNGVVTGYRVRPGRDRATFQRSGLQRNDIIRAVNGVPFNDPSATMGLLSDLATMKQVTLEVDRRGQVFNIVLGLGQ